MAEPAIQSVTQTVPIFCGRHGQKREWEFTVTPDGWIVDPYGASIELHDVPVNFANGTVDISRLDDAASHEDVILPHTIDRLLFRIWSSFNSDQVTEQEVRDAITDLGSWISATTQFYANSVTSPLIRQ